LIQTARDKATEILKSFNENKEGDSVLNTYPSDLTSGATAFLTNVLTPYWLTLSLINEKG